MLCIFYYNKKIRLENRLRDTVAGEEGEGEMYGESSMEACTLPYVKETASGSLQTGL